MKLRFAAMKLLCPKDMKKSERITFGFLVGEGGFEPPKLSAADLQSVPFGHSGTLPY